MDAPKLKKGMIVRFAEATENGRNWVVLPVTAFDLSWRRRDRVVNAAGTGLYGFGGLWYGSNPFKIQSYGKITPLDVEKLVIVRRHLSGLSVKQIRDLV